MKKWPLLSLLAIVVVMVMLIVKVPYIGHVSYEGQAEKTNLGNCDGFTLHDKTSGQMVQGFVYSYTCERSLNLRDQEAPYVFLGYKPAEGSQVRVDQVLVYPGPCDYCLPLFSIYISGNY